LPVAERTFEKDACIDPSTVVFAADVLAGVGRDDLEVMRLGVKPTPWKSPRTHENKVANPPIIATSSRPTPLAPAAEPETGANNTQFDSSTIAAEFPHHGAWCTPRGRASLRISLITTKRGLCLAAPEKSLRSKKNIIRAEAARG
jgi:hypothetical protein